MPPTARRRLPHRGSLSSATSTSSAASRTARCVRSPRRTAPSCSSASARYLPSSCPPRPPRGRCCRRRTTLEETNVLLAAFHVGDYIPWLSWVSYVDGTDARVTRAFQRIDRILDEIVDAAAATRETPLSGEEGSDDDAFIHVLLSLQQKKEQSPAGTTAEWRLSRDNVKALLEDLFGAGTEATIIVLEWAMAELLRNKGAMQKLQREVRQARSTSSDDGHGVGEQDLAGTGMEYLRAVIKETMRLHTPGPCCFRTSPCRPLDSATATTSPATPW
ncbi:hypothetical protein SORBI_3007G133766 [Sorghum bicolor]|uniref:Uncharacterized protein n=1 Tax=Sorghum bicolor TaxID=4558 RepID=A0A1Z5R9N3_SORBI|nr:hypothetical protein SORBI_3007G133766 [Sorghum bicolor]